MFTDQLHPRAPVGQANGGQFVAASGSKSSSSSSAKGKTGAKKPAVAPNGLGYSAAQWAQLQKLEAMAKAGKKLDAHQKHLLHVAHQKRLAAMAKAKPKPKKTTAKAKTTAKKPAAKPKTTAKKTSTKK